MLRTLRMFRSKRDRFLRAESGAVTIEAVLWIPFFFVIMAVAVDVSMIFHAQSRILRVVQDVNRSMSVGRIGKITDAEAQIASMLPDYRNGLEVRTSVHSGLIDSVVSVPIGTVTFTGVLSPMRSLRLTVQSYHFEEL